MSTDSLIYSVKLAIDITLHYYIVDDSLYVGRVISNVCDFVCLCFCMCVRTVEEKRLKLLMPNEWYT